MSIVTYMIPQFGKKKYKTLKDTQDFCDKQVVDGQRGFTIIECTENEIHYMSKTDKPKSIKAVETLVMMLREKICNAKKPIT